LDTGVWDNKTVLDTGVWDNKTVLDTGVWDNKTLLDTGVWDNKTVPIARAFLGLHNPLLAPIPFSRSVGSTATTMHLLTSPKSKDLDWTAREA
jgi:hypothetical protein